MLKYKNNRWEIHTWGLYETMHFYVHRSVLFAFNCKLEWDIQIKENTFVLKTFLMWTIFKAFIEFVTILLLGFFCFVFFYFYCFCFMFWFFGREACGILTPQPDIELTPPALDSEVLTTAPPGKSQEKHS